MEVLRQSSDLRQVLQLKWVIVGGMTDAFCSSWVILRLAILKFLWCMLPGRLP